MPPPQPNELGSGRKYVWKHADGRLAWGTPASMAMAHGLDCSYAYRMTNLEKYPHHLSHKGWRIDKTPNPGSDEALQLNCVCPVLDNHHGRGIHIGGVTRFWINGDCPLHGKKEEDTNGRGINPD